MMPAEGKQSTPPLNPNDAGPIDRSKWNMRYIIKSSNNWNHHNIWPAGKTGPNPCKQRHPSPQPDIIGVRYNQIITLDQFQLFAPNIVHLCVNCTHCSSEKNYRNWQGIVHAGRLCYERGKRYRKGEIKKRDEY